MTFRLVRPDAPDDAGSRIDLLAELLIQWGVDPTHAPAIAELFAVAEAGLIDREQVDPDALERVIETLGRDLAALQTAERTAAVSLVFATYWLATTAYNFPIWLQDKDALRERVVERLLKRVPDASDALASIFAAVKDAPQSLRRSGLVAALLCANAVDPRRFLDVERIRAETKGTAGQWNQAKRDADPSLPDYWVTLDAARAFDAFAAMARDEPRTSLGAFATGLGRAISIRFFEERAALVPFAQLLCARRRTEELASDDALTHSCWEYGRWALEADPEALPDDRDSLRALALAELGKMRSLLRGNDAETQERFRQRQDYLHTAAFFVLRTDRAGESSLWDVMRRLLLALRELAHIAVPPDLRTWSEAGLPAPPQPWAWVPTQTAQMLEVMLSREMELDPGLARLRRSFGQYCLDRLKTRDPDATAKKVVSEADLLEPDPCWRLSYVCALRELGVNPGGRGHRILGWSKNHDPDPQVREEAARAYTTVRHDHGLPEGVSPRRAIHAAYWWLRQAHVVALKGEFDGAGAKRTHRKEVRRSRELDSNSV